MSLWGVECVKFTSVGPQLLHSSCSKGVASRNQNTEIILHQPETDLEKGITKSFLHNLNIYILLLIKAYLEKS